jgi:hypothetical protein
MTAQTAAQRSARVSSRLAIALAVVVVLLAAAVIPLLVWAHSEVGWSTGEQIGQYLPLAGVGLIVARRQPRNPIGWLLIAAPAGVFLSDDAGPYILLVYRLGHRLPLGPVAAVLANSFVVLYVTLPLVVLLFPDGRLNSRPWRWIMHAYLGVAGCIAASYLAATVQVMLAHPIRFDASGGFAAIDNPAGSTAWLGIAFDVILPLLGAFWLAFIIRLLRTARRAAGERRQQLKWLLAGSAIALVDGIADSLVAVFAPHAPAAIQAIVDLPVGFIALAVCLGVAILRYRLYDIDRIISRTLAYTIVTAVLAGLYAGLVLLATEVLDLTSQVAVAAATLAAAALFSPLRRGVQHRVDRRFNRARYDADNTVAVFAARLQDATDPDAVRSDLLGTVHHALEPAQVSLWLAGGTR